MPLYEGIGLISEKHAVVLDIGWDTTKCGYAGEVSPRCIIPSKVDTTRILDTTDPDKLYALLVDFVHHLYFKWLLVNPKDRRVVIVENLLGSSLFKDTLVKVLFRHYEVSSVLCAPSHLVSLFSLGVNTGATSFVGTLNRKLIGNSQKSKYHLLHRKSLLTHKKFVLAVIQFVLWSSLI